MNLSCGSTAICPPQASAWLHVGGKMQWQNLYIELAQSLVTRWAPALAFALLGVLLWTAVPFLEKCWKLRHLPFYRDPDYKKLPWLLRLILGNVEMLEPNHHLFLRKAGQEAGGLFRLRVINLQAVVCIDARWVNIVLGASESLSKFLEPDGADEMLSVSGHRTLFSADTNSKHWKLIRKGTAGAFQQKNVKHGFPSIQKMANQLVANLRTAGPTADTDINNITMRYAMDVTGLVGFAKDFGTCRTFDDADTDEIFDLLRNAMLETYKRAVNPVRRYLLFLPEVWKGRRLFLRMQERMRELVREVKGRGALQDDDVSIAAHLLKLRDPVTLEPLSEDLLTGEFGVYFTAGIESAGNAMSWTLLMISEHPEVESKILEELDKLELIETESRPEPREMTLQDLTDMPYFANVCKETMRMKPVASSGTTRKTKRELQLGKYLIPAGTLCVCPFDAIHHNPSNWEDHDQFKPERWEQSNTEILPGSVGTANGAVKRYLPFSTGPRQCIGQSLAHMMHDVGVAILLSHFHFKLAPKMGGMKGVLATEINRLTLQPGSGLWMNAFPRSGTVNLDNQTQPQQ